MAEVIQDPQLFVDAGGNPNDRVKVTINLLRREIGSLQRIASERGVSFTQIVREAIAQYTFMHDAARRSERVLLQNPEGQLREIVFPR